MFRVTNVIIEAKNLLEQIFPLFQWNFSQVIAIAIQQIKRVVSGRNGFQQLSRRIANACAILQLLKIATARRIQSHYFAVDDRFAGVQLIRQVTNLRVLQRNFSTGT